MHKTRAGLLPIAALLASIVMTNSAAAAELLVVAVENTDAFAAGDVIDSNEKIDLSEGARLTVINSFGQKIFLSGDRKPIDVVSNVSALGTH